MQPNDNCRKLISEFVDALSRDSNDHVKQMRTCCRCYNSPSSHQSLRSISRVVGKMALPCYREHPKCSMIDWIWCSVCAAHTQRHKNRPFLNSSWLNIWLLLVLNITKKANLQVQTVLKGLDLHCNCHLKLLDTLQNVCNGFFLAPRRIFVLICAVSLPNSSTWKCAAVRKQ